MKSVDATKGAKVSKIRMSKVLLMGLVAGGAALCAQAQTLVDFTVEPATAKVGETVKLTGSFSGAENPNCAVRVNFGDGRLQPVRLNQTKDIPLVLTTQYDKPGEYTLQIEPRGHKLFLRCLGTPKTATLKVLPADTAKDGSGKGNSTVKTVGPETVACPVGWSLSKAGVNKKTGAYTCTAAPRTVLPRDKLNCPAPLNYFESFAEGRIGCRP
jgi:hypothetical protein